MGPLGALAQDSGAGGGASGYVPPDRGHPDLSANLPDNEVGTGTIEELQFEITNDGEIISGSGSGVTDAQSVSVEMDDDGPFEAQMDEVSIGAVQDGGVAEAVFPVAVPDDIESGEYEVNLDISYTYAEKIGSDGSVDRERETESVDVTVEVPDEPRFEVADVNTDVEPGASGDAILEIENTGTKAANETRATITGGGGVVVDGEAAREVLGDIGPGESATAVVNVQVNKATSSGEKPLDLEFTYRDENGVKKEAQSVTASLAPADEQEFSIQNVESDLSVGYEGDISGQVRNDGPQTVDDAVLVVEPMSETVFIEDTRYALPEIAPGETADFTYPTDVSGEADGGARQLRFTVEYMGGDDTPLEDGPLSERVIVEDRQDGFSISGDNASVEQGESNEVALEITNERSETLSNINAMLYTSGELGTDDDEAFVDELAPGESAEITFDVSATSAASAKTHPVELDFQYDTESGETIVSDTYQHPIEVTESEDDGGGITGTLVGILGALAVAGVGITIWWRRG
ncbi:COG1361 S-layer family protein [Halostagnicola sp. A56]|uniref:COG1361 S-layer family protein n=1 Tax=Halostagnicola sp. A56 TaxID=1495067 RepID=UPI0018CD2F4E|nr:COG1361 S-layer family protein [Halostagnicola sp. A56]